ncbi:MAG TPA: 30S ribosomal protein S7 [Chloroflexi bacterium]|jgi:small subunit ribosomal protein S7|nr:30S ribosomal protein S7 [Chloroflexota bacterium]
MPRRYRPEPRPVRPDVRYNSELLSTFMNKVMRDGKRSTAERLVYDALDIVAERSGRDALETFEQALRNISPMIEVKPRRVGGATYQVPVEVAPGRRTSLAMRWLLTAARNRPGRSFAQKLADEIMDAARNTGAAVKRREDTHRMADANKAFAHYRW